jgi:hypothetical protein
MLFPPVFLALPQGRRLSLFCLNLIATHESRHPQKRIAPQNMGQKAWELAEYRLSGEIWCKLQDQHTTEGHPARKTRTAKTLTSDCGEPLLGLAHR